MRSGSVAWSRSSSVRIVHIVPNRKCMLLDTSRECIRKRWYLLSRVDSLFKDEMLVRFSCISFCSASFKLIWELPMRSTINTDVMYEFLLSEWHNTMNAAYLFIYLFIMTCFGRLLCPSSGRSTIAKNKVYWGRGLCFAVSMKYL
jgi:hypothetical protein